MSFKRIKTHYFALLVLTSFLLTLSVAHGEVTPRIINGSTGFTATYPWMASITVISPDGLFEGGCGGSLIAPNWVLTAAHCFLDETGDNVDPTAASRTEILLNSDTKDPKAVGSFSVTAKQVIVHPNFNPNQLTSLNNSDFDIALVELNTSVNLPTMPLAAATSTPLADDTQTIIMGWGATGVDANQQSINPSNSLLQAQQKIVSKSQCDLMYSGSITDNMLCAGAIEPNDTTDACQGDSGGPMLVSTTSGLTQVGIVSFGGVCGVPDEPGVYARVSKLNTFISQYATAAVFEAVNPLQFNCTNNTIDSGLNITMPSLSFAGQTFGVQLSLVDQTKLLWQWDGMLGSSACASLNTVCATLANDLSLTIPGVSIGGTSYTVTLAFSATHSTNGKIIWQYQNVKAE